jgi:beta-N-acetylhexosaminidase
MTAHIELPALDPDPNAPATLSRRIATGLLRDELQFKGLVYTDSFTMQAITNMLTPPGRGQGDQGGQRHTAAFARRCRGARGNQGGGRVG